MLNLYKYGNDLFVILINYERMFNSRESDSSVQCTAEQLWQRDKASLYPNQEMPVTNWAFLASTPTSIQSYRMVSVALPYYSLHSAAQSKWTATQEKSLSREYPFVDLHLETPEQYIQRTYLQFLWLPEVRVLCEYFALWSLIMPPIVHNAT